MLVAVPAYAAIVIITLSTGVRVQDAWFPLSIIVAILLIAISFISPSHGK